MLDLIHMEREMSISPVQGTLGIGAEIYLSKHFVFLV